MHLLPLVFTKHQKDNMKYAIGDVHGMYHTLLDLIDKIKSSDANPTFIFVGDYIDRGPFSKEVVDLIISLVAEGHHAIRGNHDDVFDWILNGKSQSDMKEHVVGTPCADNVLSWWCVNGFLPCLKSYGVDIEFPPDWEQIREDIQNITPESHKQFFRNLPMCWECDTHIVVHGSLDPSLNISRFGLVNDFAKSRDLIENALWSRYDIGITSTIPVTDWNKIGVFGHTPVQFYNKEKAIITGDIRLIDTGAMFGGALTALCLETDEPIAVPSNQKDM